MFSKHLFQVGVSLSVTLAALSVSPAALAAESSVSSSAPSSSNSGTASSAPVAPIGGTSRAQSAPLSMDDFYFSLFSNFHGPQLTNFGKANSLDAKGKPSSRTINFDSNMTAAYLITPTIGVGFEVPFFFLPDNKTSGFELGDVAIKAFSKKMIKTQNLTVYGNIILQAITSDYSRSLGQDFAVKTTPNFRYNIPSSRFSFGAWTEAKAYLGAEKGKLFKLWAAPHVDYQITPKLSAIIQYEYETNHMVNSNGLFNFTMYQADFTPGIAYFITPHVMINPYAQIFTTEKIAMDRVGFGAIITASL